MGLFCMSKSKNDNEFKETEIGLIPEDWEVVRLRDVAKKIKAGGTPRKTIKEYWGGNIPFVLIQDITSSALYLQKTNETITEKGLKESNAWLVPPNSLLLSMYATIGETAINIIPVATNQAILAIIPKDNFDVVFGAFLLRFNAERLKMHNIQSTQKNVNKGVVENFKIPLPPLPEQKRIAYVLSTIQNAKEKTENVINSLKEFKKSMMKHLFTYGPVSLEEAEKVKLKETEIGRIPKDWEVVQLSDEKYFEILPSGIEYFPDTKIYLSTSSIEYNKIISNEGEITYKNRLSRANMQPRMNTVWFAKMKNTIKVYSFTEKNAEEIKKYILSTGFAGILCKENIEPQYLEQIFLSNWFNQIKDSSSHGSTQQAINNKDIERFRIPLPPLPEQKRIAFILSAIDSRIEAEEAKKKALDELFNSMLHNLMTGKIRVKGLTLKEV